jgi:DNA-binding XRE family transcriptional regulator
MKPPSIFIRPALKSFGQELRAARFSARMSTGELAKRAKMSRQGLLKIEKGGNATLGTIILLANALDCQISDFFPHKAPWRWKEERLSGTPGAWVAADPSLNPLVVNPENDDT